MAALWGHGWVFVTDKRKRGECAHVGAVRAARYLSGYVKKEFDESPYGRRRYEVARGLTGHGRLSLHSLRHGYASLLIANGLDVVFVSRQLGHAKATTTLGVYAHLFAQADHADAARVALQATYDTITAAETL
jgi:integrase